MEGGFCIMLDTRNSYLEIERRFPRPGLLRAWLGQGGAFALVMMVLLPYGFGVLARLVVQVPFQGAHAHTSISSKRCLSNISGAQPVLRSASRYCFRSKSSGRSVAVVVVVVAVVRFHDPADVLRRCDTCSLGIVDGENIAPPNTAFCDVAPVRCSSTRFVPQCVRGGAIFFPSTVKFMSNLEIAAVL